MAKFKIGDEVIAIKPVDGKACLVGKMGRVICLSSGIYPLGVEFEERFAGGHSGHGGKDGCCRFGFEDEFELAIDLREPILK